jgi:uncharacterized protein
MKTVQITKQSNIPLIGHIAFGIIDRGSTLLQIRPTSVCNLSCIFCSTDAGPCSRTHKTAYLIDPDYLIQETNKVIEQKQCKIHINIDSVGEPTAYPQLKKLISELKNNPKVSFISMQTNGTLLTKEKISQLEKAGLNRIHLSIHTTDPKQAKELMGNNTYNIKNIINLAKDISKTKIELTLAPVLIPKINDQEIENLIILAKELNCKICIQKYEEYKYSRKPKKAKKTNYYKFYKHLSELENKYKIKLNYKKAKMQIQRAKSLPLPIKIKERINAKVLAEGWFENQKLVAHKNRVITVNNCQSKIGDKINLRIIENKNNIYIAKKV